MVEHLNSILNRIEKFFSPKSVFLFGSRARGDYLRTSDYEIGVLFNKKDYINEERLNHIVKPPSCIHIYPYEYKKFIKGKIDIPFPVNIYLREIIITGKTLRGEKILEKIIPTPITVVDMLQDIKFSLARGSDAIVSHRNGDKKTASILFYKSCLFGTRDLIILLLKKIPTSYFNIYKLSKKINLKEYRKLVYSAYQVRNGDQLNQIDLFKNIIYLNKFIEKKVNTYYKKWGDKILIK